MPRLKQALLITVCVVVALFVYVTSTAYAAKAEYKPGDPVSREWLGEDLAGFMEKYQYLYGFESTDQGFVFLFQFRDGDLNAALRELSRMARDRDDVSVRLIAELSTDPLSYSILDLEGETRSIRHDWRVFAGERHNEDGKIAQEIVVRFYVDSEELLQRVSVPLDYEMRLVGSLADYVREHNAERGPMADNKSEDAD